MNGAFRALVAGSSLLVLVACGADGQKATAGDSSGGAAQVNMDEPIKGGRAVLTVFGMSCPLCANNVDKVLLDVPGVTGVSVDMGTGRADVSLDSKTPPTRRMLEDAVARSGFTLKSVEVP
jgi:copper chaperone